jgi:hypothetical protein
MCDVCGALLTSDNRDDHMRIHWSPSSPQPSSSRAHLTTGFHCEICHVEFDSVLDLNDHTIDSHYLSNDQIGGGIGHEEGVQYAWQGEDGEVDDGLKDMYKKYAHLIYRKSIRGAVRDEINFGLDTGNISNEGVTEQLQSIFSNEQKAFKINFSLGFVLRDVQGRLRYFYAHDNESVMDEPFMVSDLSDLNRLIAKLREMDFIAKAFQQRPNTKSHVVCITNIRYIITHTSYVLGAVGGVDLPKYITKRRCLVSLERNYNTKRCHSDQLCAFRCLAYHRTKKRLALERLTKTYASEFHGDVTKLEGLDVSELSAFENVFKINVNVFELSEDESCTTVYRSRGTFNDTMNLNVYHKHLSYITNMRAYTRKYKCRNCSKLFPSANRLKRHETTCSDASKYIYPGGYHQPRQDLWTQLTQYGFQADSELMLYPFFICYDFECLLRKTHESSASGNLQWTHVHEPVSCSIASNVPGFTEAKCIVCTDLRKLLVQTVAYMTEIQSSATAIMHERLRHTLTQVRETVEQYERYKESYVASRKTPLSRAQQRNDDDDDDDCDEECNETGAFETDECEAPSAQFLELLDKPNTFKSFMKELSEKYVTDTPDPRFMYSDDDDSEGDDLKSPNTSESESESDGNNNASASSERPTLPPLSEYTVVSYLRQLRSLYHKLTIFVEQIPVVGFSSGKYDLNAIKREIASVLEMPECSPSDQFVVKRGNTYVCLANKQLKFIDITEYLAPHCSYREFIKAYSDDELQKSYFCYEWLDHPDKLDYPRLPSLDDFYSSLKGTNVLDEEYFHYVDLIQHYGMREDEALREMELSERPKTGIEKYAELENIWTTENMQNVCDFLKYYNNLDVKPFVTALGNLMHYYHKKNIDVLKEHISIPGVARNLLFSSSRGAGAHFSLCDENTKDIYHTLRDNIVGGAATIMTRFHEVGKTFIRDGPKPCVSIKAYDSNALYVFATDHAMPCSHLTIRRRENDFKKETRDRYLLAYKYLEWLSHTERIEIRHKFNFGEKRIGPYLVDGYAITTNTCYEMNGCWFHGHRCYLTANITNDKWLKRAPLLDERTRERADYIRTQGYTLVEMRECEFKSLVARTPALREFLTRFDRPLDRITKPTQDQILEHVRTGTFFGAVECDIHVPDDALDKFAEMCPLFCNTDVEIEHIGTHMAQHVSEHNLSTKPRRLLVAGMRARKILLASPLLQWYLQEGLVVTHVYMTLEYTPVRCFRAFVSDVTDSRRRGDADPKLAICADVAKLCGNAGYGSLLMSREKHRKVDYVRGVAAACMRVNDRRFRELTELANDCFEIESAKRRIQLDQPVQCAFFILNYAKLHLLQFYYNFLDKYVDRSDYEVILSDTDSLYLALSGNTLDELIKPGLRTEFEREKNQWLPRSEPESARKHDRRTPGLFKLEAEGTAIVALNSKTYVLRNKRTGRVKFSCKGISKKQFRDPYDLYKSVLDSRNSRGGQNTGFRTRSGVVYTYKQTRMAFSYLYCKRKTLDDGIHTYYLDIELSPLDRRSTR